MTAIGGVRDLAAVLISVLYVFASATRAPDSDYKNYVTFFDARALLSDCNFDLGFCYLVFALQKLHMPHQLAFGLIYGAVFLGVVLVYLRFSRGSLQSLVGLLTLIFFISIVNDYYMAFHLYRQNISVLAFALFLTLSPYLAFIVGGLLHLSLVVIMPVYFLMNLIDLSRRATRMLLLVFCLVVQATSDIWFTALKNLLQFAPLSSFASRTSIYFREENTWSINHLPLFFYVATLFIIVGGRWNNSGKEFRILYTLFAATILVASLTSFSNMVSYRFLVIGKILSLPIILIVLPSGISIFLRKYLPSARLRLQDRSEKV
jgi:hypothetical protein